MRFFFTELEEVYGTAEYHLRQFLSWEKFWLAQSASKLQQNKLIWDHNTQGKCIKIQGNNGIYTICDTTKAVGISQVHFIFEVHLKVKISKQLPSTLYLKFIAPVLEVQAVVKMFWILDNLLFHFHSSG